MSPQVPQKQKVVIIGAGLSGVAAAKELIKNPNVELTILTTNPFFEWPLAMPLFVTDPSVHHKFLCNVDSQPLLKSLTKGKNAAKLVIGSAINLENIENKDNNIDKKVIYTPFGKDATTAESLVFDFLIVATGDDLGFVQPHATDTLEKRAYDVKRLNDRLKSAKKIVVVGGGSVGVELVGQIREMRHKMDKKNWDQNVEIILCISGNEVLYPDSSAELKSRVTKELTKQKVTIRYNMGRMSDAPKTIDGCLSLKSGEFGNGSKIDDIDVILPCFSSGPMTNFVKDGNDSLLDLKGKVDVNDSLHSKQIQTP